MVERADSPNSESHPLVQGLGQAISPDPESGRAQGALPPTVGAMNELMTVQEVCDLLKVSRSTFEKWRQRRIGPKAMRLPNGQLRIQRSELDEWLQSQAAAW